MHIHDNRATDSRQKLGKDYNNVMTFHKVRCIQFKGLFFILRFCPSDMFGIKCSFFVK